MVTLTRAAGNRASKGANGFLDVTVELVVVVGSSGGCCIELSIELTAEAEDAGTIIHTSEAVEQALIVN